MAAYYSPAARRDDHDKRVLAALRLWRKGPHHGGGIGDPSPVQLLARDQGRPLMRAREVSAALQRLKARGEVLRTHLGWELPAEPAQEPGR